MVCPRWVSDGRACSKMPSLGCLRKVKRAGATCLGPQVLGKPGDQAGAPVTSARGHGGGLVGFIIYQAGGLRQVLYQLPVTPLGPEIERVTACP